MKKTINFLLAGLVAFGIVACDKPQPEEDDNKDEEGTETPVDPGNGDENGDGNGDQGNTQKPQQFEFPFIEEFPIECGNLLVEGSEVGVTIEVTKVEDQNFVFELRPGPLVQSFKLDVYPLAQLYNNLLNDKAFGNLTESESWAVNERIREYLFNESGSGGYAFSINDFEDADDFLQVEFDWMNTPYSAASAIAIPDCDYIIAVVASTEENISSVTQEDLTLCYVHTTSQPLIGDPQCEIEVNAGYTSFGVQHYLNADAAAVYFFGYLSSEIDAYIDAFGDTLFRDFIRTRVTAPSVENDPNNPESLYYSVKYGDEADATIMSTTCAVAVDANLTPQEGYSRRDFHLMEVPEDMPEAELAVDVLEDRVASSYVEFDVTFSKDCQTVFYNVFPVSYIEEINAMSAKDKRTLARYIRDFGYGCHNPNFAWDAEAGVATGGSAVVRLEAVSAFAAMDAANVSIWPGNTYAVVFVGRNGAQQLTELQISETFTTDKRNLESPDNCKAKDLKLVLDNPGRTQFRGTITYDPATVSMVYVQYMTADNNPGLDQNSSWKEWIDFILGAGSSNMLINAWPTDPSGRDGLTWTGMTPDTDYTVFMCAEDFDGNISPMHFATIRTSEIQVGPDPTINMALVPSNYDQYDWTVTYKIDHDVEYFLYCYTDNPADLSAFMPGINKGHMNNIKDSGYSYEDWVNGIYEWVAGGFEENGGGMRAESDTSQDFAGSQTVIAACIAAGRDADGTPVYKLYHLICQDGKAQTLEEIFGIE
ncbi:MAG: hypothetical protein J6Q37_00855 [Bacteroidales bacterium]|nr:hypothetical protein [Bacteroidales bacterium]